MLTTWSTKPSISSFAAAAETKNTIQQHRNVAIVLSLFYFLRYIEQSVIYDI